jgi:hypothetical protein
MKNNRITRAILVVSFLLVGSASTALSSSTYFVPLGDGISFTYNDIPFELEGADLEVKNTSFDFVPTQSIDLSGYTTEKIHIIEFAAWADNVPDGVVVGHIKVHYADGSSETLDLVVGVNIAEWAYDRPEIQPYLQHTKVPPAYSDWTNSDSAYYYWGHNFYVQITTQEKPLDSLELILNPISYTGQTYYGYASADWFGIGISAITLQAPAEEVSIDIKPTSCPNPLNLKSNGVVPVAILGTDELDVQQIDLTTIMLSCEDVEVGIEPLRWAYEDVATPFEGQLCDCHTLGPDGYLDLTLKFSATELAALVEELGFVEGETVLLSLTGNLLEEFGGSAICGDDCMRLQ